MGVDFPFDDVPSFQMRPWNCDLVVDWAEQQDEPDEDTMAKVKVLYVRNLREAVTEEQLKEMFQVYGEVSLPFSISDNCKFTGGSREEDSRLCVYSFRRTRTSIGCDGETAWDGLGRDRHRCVACETAVRTEQGCEAGAR